MQFYLSSGNSQHLSSHSSSHIKERTLQVLNGEPNNPKLPFISYDQSTMAGRNQKNKLPFNGEENKTSIRTRLREGSRLLRPVGVRAQVVLAVNTELG